VTSAPRSQRRRSRRTNGLPRTRQEEEEVEEVVVGGEARAWK